MFDYYLQINISTTNGNFLKVEKDKSNFTIQSSDNKVL